MKIKRDILIILGNGFSIDLVKHLNLEKEINLINLFENGDKVPWPANSEPGFLSCCRCPALWQLGARPNIENKEASKIIEDVITCANVNAFSRENSGHFELSNTYLRAYHELVLYLKYLFIYYNHILSDNILTRERIEEWGWGKLFKTLNDSVNITSVNIITYNYDILLERVLKKLKIEYSMRGFDKSNLKKVKIIKPHGSISFRSAKEYDKDAFSIKYNRDGLGGKIEDLVVDETLNLEIMSNINTMIPPAGESERYQLVWSNVLKKHAIDAARELREDDEVIFGGVSYCNVDRREIDEELINIDIGAKIKVVNPDTQNTFGAVISSLFGEYTHFVDSKILGGLYND